MYNVLHTKWQQISPSLAGKGANKLQHSLVSLHGAYQHKYVRTFYKFHFYFPGSLAFCKKAVEKVNSEKNILKWFVCRVCGLRCGVVILCKSYINVLNYVLRLHFVSIQKHKANFQGEKCHRKDHDIYFNLGFTFFSLK